MKQPQRKPQSFDPERFISGAATATTADKPTARPRRVRSKPKKVSKAKPAAAGFIRSSFDLPEDLHERLKIAAVKERRPMRDLVEEAIVARLKTLGY